MNETTGNKNKTLNKTSGGRNKGTTNLGPGPTAGCCHLANLTALSQSRVCKDD